MGRPRITPEELQTRVARYCAQYGVAPAPNGLPPFPAGQRETPQHREWIVLYKTHSRLLDRARDVANACPICQQPLDADGLRAASHQRCLETVERVETLGAEGLERLGRYLWPGPAKKKKARMR